MLKHIFLLRLENRNILTKVNKKKYENTVI